MKARPVKRAALAMAICLMSGLVGSCAGCPVVDYTVPPPLAVLGPADALVRATVERIQETADGRIEADLAVLDVLHSDATLEAPSPGRLRVGAYDDPCSRRSGLSLADGDAVLVVLRWIGADNGTWTVPWQAYPVLAQGERGVLTFLDRGDSLNQRIDEILPSPTLDGLIEAVSQPDD